MFKHVFVITRYIRLTTEEVNTKVSELFRKFSLTNFFCFKIIKKSFSLYYCLTQSELIFFILIKTKTRQRDVLIV